VISENESDSAFTPNAFIFARALALDAHCSRVVLLTGMRDVNTANAKDKGQLQI
jgi:hypothetical protein